MGLYGDKLTKSAGTAVDVLTKTVGTQIDNFTKSAGAQADLLTKSAGAAIDNLLHLNTVIKNGNFETGSDPLLATNWLCDAGYGAPSVIDPGINGKSQKVTDLYSDGHIHVYQNFGFTIKEVLMRLRFSFIADGPGSRLEVYQSTINTLIYSFNAPDGDLVNVDMEFTADGMTGILFLMPGTSFMDYMMLDDVILEVHKQDNLTYGV